MSRKSKLSQTPADRNKPHHKGVLFLEGIPKTTKADFKAACAMREITMRDAILSFMRNYIKETIER